MLPKLTVLLEMAKEAGKILRDGYGKKHEIDHKGSINLVTEIDQKSETYLVKTIREKFPEHTIIAEESGKHQGSNHACWYIDPLDGTSNYAHDIPIFSVSIAFEVEGEIQLGVVYDPLREECFYAEKGKGAWLNEKKISTTHIEDLSDGLLTTGFPYDIRTTKEDNLANYAYFAKHAHAVRRLGSAALDLCYVAAGRFDGYWELTTGPWDIAAGILIVREAGGKVTDITGKSNPLHPPYGLVATGPGIHAALLEGLNRKTD